MIDDLETKITEVTFKHHRYPIACVFELPEEIRDKTPKIELKKCVGTFLLTFPHLPIIGEMFPYGGHVWKVPHVPLQIPTRYKSRQKKSPAFIFCEHIIVSPVLSESLAFIIKNSGII